MKSSKSRARAMAAWFLASAVASACSLFAPTDDDLRAGAGREAGGQAGDASGGTASTGGVPSTGAQGGSGGRGSAGTGAGLTSGASGVDGGSGVGGASGAGGSEAGGGSGATGTGGDGASGGGSCLVGLLVNGDFDDGPTGWSEESSDETPLIFHRANTLLVDQNVEPHSADYLAWLGGSADRTARVWRAIELPDGVATVRVTGFYRINTDESYPAVFDEAYVELVQGTTAYALGHFTNQDDADQWTEFEDEIGADVFGGGTITFQLRSRVDVSGDTEFFFDSISLTAELADCL